MTREELRAELLEVRKYYSLKDVFDKADKNDYVNRILELVKKYDYLVLGAEPLQIKLYYLRFHEGVSLEAVALNLGYSTRYIETVNKKLYDYFMTKLEGVQPT